MGGAIAPPASRPNRAYILSDIPVTATSAEERIAIGRVGGHGRIADYAAHGRLQLKLLHSGPQGVGLVLAHLVQHLLDTGSGVGVDGGGVHGTVVIHAVNGPDGLTAALLVVKPHLIDSGVDGGKALTQVSLDAIKSGLLAVIQPTNSVFQIVEVHGIAQARFGNGFAVSAPVAPAISAPSEDHGEQQNEHPCAIPAETAPTITVTRVSGNCGNIAKRVVVH